MLKKTEEEDIELENLIDEAGKGDLKAIMKLLATERYGYSKEDIEELGI
jgi:hypothetical protein